MLRHILRPALIISPYIGFSFEEDLADHEVALVAKVIQCSPTCLKVHVMGPAYNLAFNSEGVITDCTGADHHGKKVFLQWQGDDHSTQVPEDRRKFLLKKACQEVLEQSAGPLKVTQLASCDQLSQMPLAEAAERLGLLGDCRLKRFLSAEFPQIKDLPETL